MGQFTRWQAALFGQNGTNRTNLSRAMKADLNDPMITAAAHWALQYARRAPGPLFATPCFYFTLSAKGLPNSESIHFPTLADALHSAPEAMLRRAKRLRHPPGTNAAVLVYALGEDEEIFSDALRPPAKFLVYVFVPRAMGTPMFERRIVRTVSGEPVVEIDRCIAFDSCTPLRLDDVLEVPVPLAAPPSGVTVH